MMGMHRLGYTRSALRADHLLQTPDTFVRTVLPGMQNASAIVHTAPAAGAAFTQYTAEIRAEGTLGPVPAGVTRFLFVLSGEVELTTASSFKQLPQGSFALIPTDEPHTVTALLPSTLAVIERPYLPGELPAPKTLTGHESTCIPASLNGDPDLQVQALIPDIGAYDMAVNLMTYQPGAALSQVEVHVMEHGLLMLEGGGIYRLGDQWYPVTAGDFIWMAPFCPQWFGALGKVPARYLIYKDWNRHPLQEVP